MITTFFKNHNKKFMISKGEKNVIIFARYLIGIISLFKTTHLPFTTWKYYVTYITLCIKLGHG
jgi:hypothetical protein